MPDRGADPLSRHLSRLDESAQAVVRRRRRHAIQAGTAILSAVMVVAVLDGVGAVDAFGPDTAIVRSRSEDTVLEVHYATVSRPALATPLEITITRPGGFGGQDVELAISTDYLTMFDLNGILPAPAEESSDRDRLLWTFTPPDGDTMRILYEARIEPAVQEGRTGRVAVLGPDGEDEVAVSFTTAIRP